MTIATSTRLTEEDLRFYERNGYLTVPQLLPQEKFDQLRAHFEDKLVNLPGGMRPEDMDVPHFTDTRLFDWLLDPGVLDLVEQIIGPDIALFSAHFFCKPAGDGKSVPWHDDAYYWRETIIPAAKAVTVWLALDPVDEENGCMRVVPGSHAPGARRYRPTTNPTSVFDEELDPDSVDPAQAVPLRLRPNECSIHSATLVHGSEANVSARRRCGFTMRYISTDVRFNHEEVGDRHQIYLARGTDRAGNVYADPSRPSPELVANRGAGQNYVGARRPGGARPGQG
ncbi:phytanoyl-CoA dioxygenase family protein [Streptomyces sp. NPDC049881]|uniref:phytanoyl-CoA dioxygenase family protein n=1 Tax=unclassified Streptomyces TaxID=2593676 RepID=UPI00342FAD34